MKLTGHVPAGGFAYGWLQISMTSINELRQATVFYFEFRSRRRMAYLHPEPAAGGLFHYSIILIIPEFGGTQSKLLSVAVMLCAEGRWREPRDYIYCHELGDFVYEDVC